MKDRLARDRKRGTMPLLLRMLLELRTAANGVHAEWWDHVADRRYAAA